jgi:hypothetical protein
MSKQNEPCHGMDAQVMGASRKMPRPRRIYRHLRQEGVVWAFKELTRRILSRPKKKAMRWDASLSGPRSKGSPLPPLKLRPGEWVEIRSKAEILETLDEEGKTAGLGIMPEMWQHCGQRFRVFKRLESFISEVTGELRTTKDTVLLEGGLCDGSAHGGCQRSCFFWWKEAWLKRVEPPPDQP